MQAEESCNGEKCAWEFHGPGHSVWTQAKYISGPKGDIEAVGTSAKSDVERGLSVCFESAELIRRALQPINDPSIDRIM
jgi:hypothetical protein